MTSVPTDVEAGARRAPVRDGAQDHLGILARSGSLSLVGAATAGILGFVLVVVVTRGLGPAGSGPLFVCITLFLILAEIATLGADTGLMRTLAGLRALDRHHEMRETVPVAVLPVVVTSTLFAAITFAFAPGIASFLITNGGADAGAEYLRALAPFLPLAAVSTVLLSGARGLGSMGPYVYLDRIGVPVARPLLVGAALSLGFGGTAVALAWAAPVAVEVVLATVALVLLLRRTATAIHSPGRRARREVAGPFWRFAAPRGLAGVFQIGVLWLDVLFVGMLASGREAGIYAAASRCIWVGAFAIQAVQLAIGPQLSDAFARHDREQAEELYRVSTGWLMAPSWPLYLLVAVFSPLLLRLFGPGFESGAVTLTVLSLAMLVNLGTGNVTVVLLMGGKSSWNLVNTAVSLVLNVVLNLLLIPRIGIVGAAIAWAVSIMWENLAPLVQVRRFMGLKPIGPGYFPLVAAAVACFGVLGAVFRLLLGPTVPALLATVVIGGTAYVFALWRLRWVLELKTFWSAVTSRVRPGAAAPVAAAASRPRPRPASDDSFAPRAPDGAAKTLVKAGLREWGTVTSGRRQDPDFLIIGAKRGGSTSLANYVFAHPGVTPLFPARQRIKGVHFFDTNYPRGLRWYRSHFPTRAEQRRRASSLGYEPVAGEASPYYLFHPLAAERAARDVPDAKIVVILRNPVDRAYSHYRERVRHGAETLSFEDAIAAEPERLRGEVDRIRADDRSVSYPLEQQSYVEQGRYLEPLRAWMERFPPSRFHVLLTEDLDADPEAALDALYRFLGLPSFRPEGFDRYNYHQGTGMDPATRERLLAGYAEDNRRLAAALDMDLSRWNE